MPKEFGGKSTASTHPEIIESHGVPEIFCDTWVVEHFDETFRIRFARTIARDGGEADLVVTMHMPQARFLEGLGRIAAQFLVKKKPDGQ